ncbi:MAG: magnesium transporter [Candidatus Izemoplasmatales bacterium]|nr:magnesium transporter [Candidatus Izemoplasmatales bacterium]
MEENRNWIDERRDFSEEISTLIIDNQHNPTLEAMLDEYHPYDVSQAMMMVPSEVRTQVMRRFDLDFAASIVEHLEEDAIICLQELPVEHAVKIIDHMESDDAVDLLQYLQVEGEEVDFLTLLSPKKRAELSKLWSYHEAEIGSKMSSSYIRLQMDMTVKEAMKYVIQTAASSEYISILYVISGHKLVGYLKLKTLIVARAEEKIADIMETRLIFSHPNENKEEVALKMQEYGESSMPIVDEKMHLVGIITHDDLMDIVAEAKSEDYARFAGLIDGEIDLERDTLGDSVKKRLPWLSILLLLSMVTSVILSFFEGALTTSQGAIILSSRLAIYLPLILDMAGNTGTQSLAVMIRYLTSSKREITFKSMRRYLLRELGTGLVQGLLIGAMIFLMISLTNGIISGTFFETRSIITGLVTAGSICIALVVSTVLGAIIPLVLNKIKIDPAVASGPFITTVTDIITLSIYYSISLALLLPLYV